MFFVIAAGLGVFPAAAQTNSASIVGQVTDESHGILPGVTVTAASPALQAPPVMAVTDGNGDYRLTALPIGTYVVKYVLTGFQSVERQDIRLTTGFVAKLDTIMKVGALEESVTVKGQSPVVDVTTTSSPTTLVREALEELPTTRNSLVSLATQTPGVRTAASGFDVGGSLFTGGTQLNSFGRNGDNWLALDGVLTTAAAGTTEGVYWDFSTYQEAVVQTAGGNAEVPSSGLYMNAVLKSGGNNFHGSGFYGVTGPRFQATNIDDALKSRGVAGTNKINERYDVSGDLGGRIVRDKVWFYGNVRRAFDDVNVINVFKPDGSPGNFPKLQRFWTIKGTYQLTPTQQLIGMEQWNGKYNVRSTVSTGWESRLIQEQVGNTRKGEWNGTFGNSTTASAMMGYWNYNSPLTGGAYGKVGTFDIGTGGYSGDEFWLAGPSPVDVTQNRYQVKATLSWYHRDFLKGNHEIRGGFDYTPGTYHNIYHPRGDSQDYYLIFRNGAPFEIGTWNIPVDPISRADYTGLFAQDNWTIGKVTLNLGLRFDRNNGYNPEQSRQAGTFAVAQTFSKVQYAIWNNIVPRLHAAWDITGKGKTVLKGGWSRFDKMRFISDVTPANLNWLTTNMYLWHDLNGNRKYDPGEVNLDLNGPDYQSSDNPPGISALPNGGGTGIPNPHEIGPKVDEFNVNFEHELMPNFAVRLSGVYAREFDLRRLVGVSRPYSSYNIPVSRPDPGPGGVFGTRPEPAQMLTYYEYPVSLRGKAFSLTMPVNDPDIRNLNKAIEVAAVKRSSNGWQMLGALGSIWPDKEFAAFSDLAPLTPNAEIWSRDQARRWYLKLGGSYRFPRLDVLASVNFNATSGEPFQRTVLVTGGTTIASLAVPAEPFGAHQYPNAYVLDIRGEKTFRFNMHRVSARVDLFNALNNNVIIAQMTQSGVNYLRPTTILPARIAVFSVSYSF
jgi:hypothetical protein